MAFSFCDGYNSKALDLAHHNCVCWGLTSRSDRQTNTYTYIYIYINKREAVIFRQTERQTDREIYRQRDRFQ